MHDDIYAHLFSVFSPVDETQHLPSWAYLRLTGLEENFILARNTSHLWVSSHNMASLLSQSTYPHELLICGVCEELYNDSTRQAKFLTCYHTFCSQCLTKLSDKEQVQRATIECPNCRSHTRVPENGIDGLQTNFYITGLPEFSKSFQPPKAVSNGHPSLSQNTQPMPCFCVTCGLSISRRRASSDHATKDGHSVINISEEETVYLQELKASHDSLTQSKKNLELVESEITLLNAAKDIAMKDIETFITLAREKLEQRQNDLMKQTMNQFNTQQNALLDIQKQIQLDIDRLNENIDQAKNITETGDISKLKTIFEDLKKGNEKSQSNSSNLDLGENHLAFDSYQGLDEFNKSSSALGHIYTKGFLPSMIAFKSTTAKTGHTATLTVEVYNHHGDIISTPPGSLSVIVTDPMNAEVHTNICATGSVHTVTFLPLTSGLHEVSGMFLGKELLSEQSHIWVSSNNPVLKLGEYGDGNGTFKYPWGITIDNNNCIYITDVVNRLIQKFAADGEFLSQFSVAVNNKDYSTPSIALDHDNGLIYCPEIALNGNVLNKGSNILVFNLEGELQHTYSLGEAQRPFFIAMNSRKDLIVSDIGKQSLSKVDKEGNFLSSMGDFKEPGYIAIDDEDNIIVPDTANHCINIFDPNGELILSFGTHGDRAGELQRPCGVASDGENILVAEQRTNRIQVFTYDGTFVFMITGDEDPLKYPRGLAVSNDGHVYVADRHCIRKFKYRDLPCDNKGSKGCDI